MTDFSCPVVEIASISRIADADAIETARVFEVDVIVPRHRFAKGDRAIYLPPDAVLPQELATSLKGQTKLFGERRNRVKPYRLRGAFSEGILIGPIPHGTVGEDAAAALGVTKYQQPVPTPWRGECVYLPGLTIAYDIRSARRYPKVLEADEPVELTEKLHGTMCAISYLPRFNHPDVPYGDTLVYSKQLGETGHVLKGDNPYNLYVRTTRDLAMRERIRAAFNGRPATVFGEIYGATIQDLDYGKAEPTFAIFDIYMGLPGRGHWLSRDELRHITGEIAPSAPALYCGPLTSDIIQQIASGPTVAGKMAHMREGVVVRPVRERDHPRIGRAILKYVSTDYLTRASGTEFQ